MKQTLVNLAAHEPSLDPRVKWEAESAAKAYEVTVVGFQPLEGRKLSEEQTSSYRTIRLDRTNARLPFLVSLSGMVLDRPILIGTLILCYAAQSALAFRHRRRALRATRATTDGKTLEPAPMPAANANADRTHDRLRRSIGNLEDGNPLRELARIYSFASYLMNVNAGLYRYVKAHFATVSVIHCTDFDTLIAGLMLKRHYGCRVVCDLHEFWSQSLTTTPQAYTGFFEYLEACFLPKADRLVTVNPMLAQEIMRVHKLHRVDSILNCEPWTASPAKAKIRSVTGDKIIFLYQGTFAPERGIEEFVDAWCRVGPDSAIFYLRGPRNSVRDEIEAKIIRSGIDSIALLPPVTEDELVAAAGVADVGVIPYKGITTNYMYCCPNKLSQYMHAGLAILTNSLPFVRSVVESNRIGLVYDVDRPESIDAAIRRLIAERNELQAMKNAALAFAANTFNWQNEEPKLLAIYGEATVG